VKVAIVLLLVVGCTGTPISSVPTLATPLIPSTASPTPPSSPRTVFGDGTHRVPDQVVPGTYRTLEASDECYWTRLGGFTGGLGDLIASRISAGFEVATIKETDAGIDSVGCGGWTDQLIQVTVTKSQFGDGTYIVGLDLDPGVYVAAGGESCEWARLSGFAATTDEVLESGAVARDALARVEIEATDAGFTSGGCGTWTHAP
jgi:hypothetical protein